jgi:hypothetical protein
MSPSTAEETSSKAGVQPEDKQTGKQENEWHGPLILGGVFLAIFLLTQSVGLAIIGLLIFIFIYI